MTAPDLVVRGRRVLTPEGERTAAVLVAGGRILDVVAPVAAPAGPPVVDAGACLVLPGVVDSHVHVNEPGRTEWEGFETATGAAAAGGVTTIVDMPLNCVPVTTSREALARKRDAAAGRVSVDCAFWGGVVPGNAGAIEGLLAAGAAGCKAFLIHSGIEDFPAVAEADLRAAMPVLAAGPAPLLAHAELEACASIAGGAPRRYASYLASRPREWENEAIQLLVRLARELRCPVHVVHLSSADAVETLRRAREEGVPISAETCPHYLFFDAEEIADGCTEFKCAPPVRERENRERLWTALAEGVIDLVASDHSPCAPELKQPGSGDFLRAWGGIASLQLALPVVWTEARRRGVAPPALARWMSERPAGLAGLAGRKGRLAPGYDADIVVFDPDACFVVEAGSLRHRHKLTPYLGRTLRGVVRATFLRGRKVYEDGELLGPPSGLLLAASGHGLR